MKPVEAPRVHDALAHLLANGLVHQLDRFLLLTRAAIRSEQVRG